MASLLERKKVRNICKGDYIRLLDLEYFYKVSDVEIAYTGLVVKFKDKDKVHCIGFLSNVEIYDKKYATFFSKTGLQGQYKLVQHEIIASIKNKWTPKLGEVVLVKQPEQEEWAKWIFLSMDGDRFVCRGLKNKSAYIAFAECKKLEDDMIGEAKWDPVHKTIEINFNVIKQNTEFIDQETLDEVKNKVIGICKNALRKEGLINA